MEVAYEDDWALNLHLQLFTFCTEFFQKNSLLNFASFLEHFAMMNFLKPFLIKLVDVGTSFNLNDLCITSL